jgi:trans-2,3-dihydro-3-hydroxyanthranilate isomerase
VGAVNDEAGIREFHTAPCGKKSMRELRETFARHFGVPPDMMEDPFTGSATGGMAAYLWRYGLIESPRFIAEQGHWMNRPGQATVEVVGRRDDIDTVKVGGNAAIIVRGRLDLEPNKKQKP